MVRLMQIPSSPKSYQLVDMQAILWFVLSISDGQKVTVGDASDEKIVNGGILTDISRAPYMVSIHVNDNLPVPTPHTVRWRPSCTGSIFTAVYVITACKCVVGLDEKKQVYPLVDGLPLEKWAFLAGAWDLHTPEYLKNPAAQIRTPASIHYHPKCLPERTPWLLNEVPVYDVAVAKMTLPFEFNSNVKPVKVYTFQQSEFKKVQDDVIGDKLNNRCIVAGWGSTLSIPISEAFTTVTLPTTESTENCGTVPCPEKDLYKLKFIRVQARYEVDCLNALVKAVRTLGQNISIDFPAFEAKFREKLKNQICALNKNASPCKGDSGSGLVCDDRYILGINSFGIGCGAGAPDVYQSVLLVLDWLEEEVCTVQTCSDVEHLHSRCQVLRPEYLEVVEKCRRTTAIIPKNRGYPDGNPSSITLITNPKWLILFTSILTY